MGNVGFTKFGTLIGSNKDQNIFHTPGAGDDGTNANVAGYSLEGFFLLRPTYAAAENGGIGFQQSTNGENQLIRVPRGVGTNLFSNSSIDNLADGPQGLEQVDTNINGIIPNNQWFHLVKVHDPVADQIRFYINGVLQGGATTALDADSTGVEYHSFGLSYGNVSVAGREIRDIGYSMTRFYRGALTDAEILANFREVAFVPEPSGFMLLALATASLWIARSRRA